MLNDNSFSVTLKKNFYIIADIETNNNEREKEK